MADYSRSPDGELVVLLKNGSHEAFAVLHERYFGLLYRHAFHRFTAFRSKQEVEDVLQDLFIKIWENRTELDPDASFKAYLYTSLKNRILNDLAKQKVQQQYLDKLQQLIKHQDDNLSTDHLVREKELIALLEKEIQVLPPKMRIAFEMSRNEHLSYEEIAALLNISPHTARTQVRNVLRILKGKFPHFIFLFFL